MSRNLGTLTSWNPLGHSRPVTGLLYLYNKLKLDGVVYGCRTVFYIWPDDGSFEPKHVAEFLILITIYIVLLTGMNYYIIAIHSGMVPIKVYSQQN